METVMGVFDSRERAEETVKELLDKHVPQEAIVFLTRSESEAMYLGKTLGAFVGGFVGGGVGVTAGVVAATLFSIPGIGQVFALGVGATAALGFAGIAVGKKLAATPNLSLDKPTPSERSPEDLAFLGEVLNDGRSVILVRTDSQGVATVAAGILDRAGISAQWHMSGRMQSTSRQIGGISVADLQGRITVGEGNILLREVVTNLLERGNKRILLNFRKVRYIDSSGLGELVKTHLTVQRQGGQLKMSNLDQRLLNLLKATSLYKVFDVYQDEDTAVQSFGRLASVANA
jgi:anti-sigma B factor antagonist